MNPRSESQRMTQGWNQPKDPVAEEEKDIARKLEKIEHFNDLRDLLARFLKQTPIRIKPTLTPDMPKRITWEQVKKEGYFMNLWDLEPLLVDALQLAKEEKRENKKNMLRGLIRSASWMTHKPFNPEMAREESERFLEEAEKRESEAPNPFESQVGLKLDEHADIEGWERVVEEVGTMDCKKEQVEASTDFVEKVFVREWKDFLQLYKDKKNKRTWPQRGIDVELEPDVQAAMDRIERLRGIRDQLYYQRLYPVLCSFGHEALKKKK